MKAFFAPRSIALIGASKDKTKVGHIIWEKLKRYPHPLYVVNPKFGFKSITAVPGTVDLAVICVPAAAVPEVVNNCVAKKVKAVIVISSVFAELGNCGIVLPSPPLPLLGPNCFGIANPASKLDTTFAKASPPPGNIGLISQSGALASYLFAWAKEEGLGFSKFVSLGNRLNLDETDFLEFLADDPQTKVIALYLESFCQGTRWLKQASRASRKKPVLVLCGGQTTAGARASLSHTATLSPPASLVATAIRQTGCFAAADLKDLTNLLEVFSLEPELTDNDLAIITNAGGPAILATDTASSLALDVGQPVDVLGDALAERFSQAFRLVLKDKAKDAFLIIITPQATTQVTQTCLAVIKRFAGVKKPLIVSLLGGRLVEPARKILRDNAIATIDLPQEAAQTLSILLQWHRQHRHHPYPVRRPYKVREKTLSFSPGRLSWHQAGRLATAYHFPLVLTLPADLPIKPAALSWPVVLKADPALTQHRTEDRALYLNLNSPSAYRLALKRLNTKFTSVLVQPQLAQGHELFIGLRQEAGWPVMLTLGGGGIYTELYQDLTRAFLPLNETVIEKLLGQTRIGQIIFGYRGARLAVKEVIRLILNVGHLIEDYPQIEELEINPALITESSATIVDLKITIS